MAKLSDREKKIVLAMNVMNNPAYKNAPFDLKTRALQAVLLSAGYKWDEHEMTDLMWAIGAEIKAANEHALKMLDKYKDHFKGLDHL